MTVVMELQQNNFQLLVYRSIIKYTQLNVILEFMLHRINYTNFL